MSFVPSDFSNHFYVANVEEMIAASEAFYLARIPYVIKPCTLEALESVDDSGEGDVKDVNGYVFCFDNWSQKKLDRLTNELVKVTAISSFHIS